MPYDSAFWQHSTTLLPNAALLDQARQRQADTLLRARPTPRWRPMPRPRRCQRRGASGHYSVICATPTLAACCRCAYRPPTCAPRWPHRLCFSGRCASRHYPQSLTYQYAFGVQLDLAPTLAAYATTRHALRQLRGEGWEAGPHLRPNLNPRGRPLHRRG
ncbi:MAG: hypothetical protein WKG07_06120 [Hymenobacter sp.]